MTDKRSLSETLNCLSLNHNRNSYFSRFCGVSRPFEVLGQVNGAKRNDHNWQITSIIRMIWRYGKWKRSHRCSSIRSLLCLVWYVFLPPKNTRSNTWYKLNMELITIIGFRKAIGLFQKYQNTLCCLSKIWRDLPSPQEKFLEGEQRVLWYVWKKAYWTSYLSELQNNYWHKNLFQLLPFTVDITQSRWNTGI